MPKVIYIESDGTEHRQEIAPGLSLMEGAVKNNIPGIEADCGGACACATCHVYIDETWLDKLGEPSETEKGMLGFVSAEARQNSRLSCQITITQELDGLIVHLPETQH